MEPNPFINPDLNSFRNFILSKAAELGININVLPTSPPLHGGPANPPPPPTIPSPFPPFIGGGS